MRTAFCSASGAVLVMNIGACSRMAGLLALPLSNINLHVMLRNVVVQVIRVKVNPIHRSGLQLSNFTWWISVNFEELWTDMPMK
ncbi:hypothetical protein Peur_044641 [Populus x canadensis]